ncbi:hypothetical protein [Halalkalibacterium halodurans]|jgi:hypothetical protein|uniref:BH3968 protein n=1 Tax=Halalkalibacterium halodurans (strain ATCC BAA-125 / DSM 18197 / FERM 7344 / JCM 9153 / C-125) TaxID=272558 RepID=Q9K5W9_HALH5|nr:hypothetical protein [Halalkalibacterium halodurans]MDY7224482.1 hypothetical protein [Halalkalibacterium halodurans]MDY7243767.1 hypothetical protein [Halalkalibacterium halodurans]MED4174524.1 hypothetical protein [Halalkalibacterium halodurans]BAB07687.1 BH3968 [Halalkalibacterium halodurans C-125]
MALSVYIAIGAIAGLFFGGMWEGITALVLIYIATILTKKYEKN